MEKTASLAALDRGVCEYHLRNNYSKQDNIFCYQPSRKQIAHFYSSMADHFYQHHLDRPQPAPHRARPHRAASQLIYRTLTDPLLAGLPAQIPQRNVLASDCAPTGMSGVPMFAELEAAKKQKYLIAREVRELLGHDIRQMQEEKEQALFRRHFPAPPARSSPQEQLQTEQLVREFNRILIKHKNNRLNAPTSLNLLEKENAVSFLAADSTSDQKFKILNLFKKLYMETKSEDINQNLVDYLLKFHLADKPTRKVSAKEGRKSNGRSKERPAKPAQSLPRRGKNQSQANLLDKPSKGNFFQQTQPCLKAKPRKEIKLRSRLQTQHQQPQPT